MKKAFLELVLIFLSISVVFYSCDDETTMPDPVISSVSPTSAGEGATVTITGENFTTDTSAIVITVGGIEAQIVSASETSISFVVPKGVSIGVATVTVTIDGRVSEVSGNITVVKNPFTITGLSKKTGKAGANIKITGTNLNATDFKVEMNNGSGKNVKQTIVTAAEDGSYLEIELSEKTYSGKFEVTRISDNAMLKTTSFTYEITYSEPELVVTNKDMNNPFLNISVYESKYYLATVSGLYRYNSSNSNVDTIFNPYTSTWSEVDDVIARENGDIVFAPYSDVVLVYTNNVLDTLCVFQNIGHRRIVEGSDGIFYIASNEDNTVSKVSEYGGTPEVIANISQPLELAIDNNGNVLVCKGGQFPLVDKIEINNNNAITEYANFSNSMEVYFYGVASLKIQPEVLFTNLNKTTVLQRLTETTFKELFVDEGFSAFEAISFDENNDLYLMNGSYVYKSVAY